MLAEDERHQRFIRSFLYGKGLKLHQIRMEPLPSGRGCGEQWVRDRYVASVRALRARTAKAESALIVAIDADITPVTRRQRQLQEALSLAGLEKRGNNEAICHFVPKRHIETWILYLTGQSVDEDSDYKKMPGVDEAIARAAGGFFKLMQSIPAGSNTIESLTLAIPEAWRLG